MEGPWKLSRTLGEDVARFFGIRLLHRPTGDLNSEQLDDSESLAP
jgi:hypothetical protein